MTDSTVDAERRAAEVLAEHEYAVGFKFSCLCGWWERPSGIQSLQEVHRTHVAAMLAQAGVLADAQHDDEVAAKTLRGQANFFKAIDMDAAADHCEQSAIGWDSAADDAARARGERTGQA